MAKLTNQPNATILSERQRQLQGIEFAPATVLTRDLPRDTTLKALLFILSGSVKYTFASGTPLSDSKSIFDNLIENITITIDGSRTVKSVRPWLMRVQSLLTTKVLPERRAMAGASAVALPTIEGGFVFGTTGQITSVYEALKLSFENVYAEKGKGREFTWLKTKGVASAEIRIATKGYDSLKALGNTTPLVFDLTVSKLNIAIFTIEQQDVPVEAQFSDWKQTVKSQPISGDVSGFLVEINKGNLLQSIQLFCEDGNAGGVALGSGNAPTNLLLTDLKLKINGQQDVKATTFLALQAENKERYGIVAPVIGGVSAFDGSVLWDFTRENDISTSLDCRAPLVDQVHIELNSRTGFPFNPAKPANVSIMTNEIVMPS